MFRFKQFAISDKASAMKIGTDGVLLGAWAFMDRQPGYIFDVGCGTGLISLMLAQRFPESRITAIEIDPEAAEEARFNVGQSPWSDRIDVVNCNFADFRPTTRVDAIVSNPPFFTEPLKSPHQQRAIARHQAELNPTSLIRWAASILPHNGRLSLIAPAEQTDRLIYESLIDHLDCSRITAVKPTNYTSPIRVMLEFTRGLTTSYKNDSLTIRNYGQYTRQYKSLTQDFYLDSTFN